MEKVEEGKLSSPFATIHTPSIAAVCMYLLMFHTITISIIALCCVFVLIRQVDGTQPDKAYLSSAWDEPPMPAKSRSRRDSISGLADPSLKGRSPPISPQHRYCMYFDTLIMCTSALVFV